MSKVLRIVTAVVLLVVVAACTDSSGTPTAPSPDVETSQTGGSISGTPVAGPVLFPLDATIPELQRAMRAGRITAVELVDFYLARIAAYDDAGPAVNALISVNPDAREEAAALDA